MRKISLWALMLALLLAAGCVTASAESQTQPDEATAAEAQKTYHLRFVDDNGKELFPTQELHEGDPLELPKAKRQNHSFRGWVWYDAFGNELERSETMPACDVTLKAHWWRKEVKSGSSKPANKPPVTTPPASPEKPPETPEKPPETPEKPPETPDTSPGSEVTPPSDYVPM